MHLISGGHVSAVALACGSTALTPALSRCWPSNTTSDARATYTFLMLGRRWSVVFAVMTSLVACTHDDDPEFDYGRDEMKEAIEGTWVSDDGAAGAPITLTLVYSAPETRPLCGNRMLSSDGAQLVVPRCTHMSSMNITGTLTSRPAASEPARDLSVRGTFGVWSLRFTGVGFLEGHVEDDALSATLSNGVLEGTLRGADGVQTSSFTLRRK